MDLELLPGVTCQSAPPRQALRRPLPVSALSTADEDDVAIFTNLDEGFTHFDYRCNEVWSLRAGVKSTQPGVMLTS